MRTLVHMSLDLDAERRGSRFLLVGYKGLCQCGSACTGAGPVAGATDPTSLLEMNALTQLRVAIIQTCASGWGS